jgi:glyoxylase-like metal-dependent hydrolase (beta-lactamase superfamily II)
MGTKLYVLDTGRMKLDKNFLIAMHNPATTENPNISAVFDEIPIYTVLIDHPEGKILFDTGCHPGSMGENGRWPVKAQKMYPLFQDEASRLINRLERLKVWPQDIKYVVASHLHMDHAGTLEFFEKAEIIVHDSEFTNTIKQYALMNKMGAFCWTDVDAWVKKELNWHLIAPNEDVIELAKGIKILNFGSGHTWGLLGLHVELPGEGGIILTSDAVYSEENYGLPTKIPSIIYDSIGFMNTVEKIRKYAERTDSRVWFGHDMKQYNSFIKSTEGYYE